MKEVFTFAIGLPRFPRRYENLMTQLRDRVVDCYEIVGVDGSDSRTWPNMDESGHADKMSAGQVGCALSHVMAYRRMTELDLPYAFVIEDDVVLPDNIEAVVMSCLPYLSPSGVISLYSPRPAATEYSNRDSPILQFGRLLSPTASLDTHTATSYLIGRSAAAGIIGCNYPVRYLADHWFAFHAEGAVDKVLLHYPMPVSVAHFDSSIGYSGSLSGIVKSILLRLPAVRKSVLRKRVDEERRQKLNIVVVDKPSFYQKEDV